MPLTAYTFIAPMLARKGLKLKQSIFLENSVTHLDQRAKALMSLPRATLVDVAYDYCDTRLNNLNPGSRHRTVPTERRTDVRKKAFVLKKERALDLGKSKWATEWRKRDRSKYRKNVDKVIKKVAKAAAQAEENKKKAPTIRLSREPLTRRQSKAATRNWIASMRQHNKVITTQSEPVFKSVEI